MSCEGEAFGTIVGRVSWEEYGLIQMIWKHFSEEMTFQVEEAAYKSPVTLFLKSRMRNRLIAYSWNNYFAYNFVYCS